MTFSVLVRQKSLWVRHSGGYRSLRAAELVAMKIGAPWVWWGPADKAFKLLGSRKRAR